MIGKSKLGLLFDGELEPVFNRELFSALGRGVTIQITPLAHNAQVIAVVAHFVEFGAGVVEGAVQDHHQLAVKGVEEHAVAGILADEGLELFPWTCKFAGFGASDGFDVAALVVAGPEHEEMVVFGAEQFGAVGDVIVLPARGGGLFVEPGSIRGFEQIDRRTCGAVSTQGQLNRILNRR